MRFMMLVKANKDYEAGAPPSPELMAAVAKLADEATARGVIAPFGTSSHCEPFQYCTWKAVMPYRVKVMEGVGSTGAE